LDNSREPNFSAPRAVPIFCDADNDRPSEPGLRHNPRGVANVTSLSRGTRHGSSHAQEWHLNPVRQQKPLCSNHKHARRHVQHGSHLDHRRPSGCALGDTAGCLTRPGARECGEGLDLWPGMSRNAHQRRAAFARDRSSVTAAAPGLPAVSNRSWSVRRSSGFCRSGISV